MVLFRLILPGCCVHDFREVSVKAPYGTEPAFLRYFRYGGVGVFQKVTGIFDSVLVKVFGERNSRVFNKVFG